MHPDNDALKKKVKALAASQNTMTLATAQGNAAWAAPVYFVLRKNRFYFFSDPDSRHIREALATGQAASAIYPEVSTWQEIRGVQMNGSVEGISPGLEAAAAIRAYVKKFPFTDDFFGPGEPGSPAAFSNRFRVSLYRYTPSLLYYLDNSIRFGFRESVVL